MKIVVACDSMKGVLTAEQVCQAAAEGIRVSMPQAQVVSIPLADGGEGTARIITRALGGDTISRPSFDPLMRPIEASFGVVTINGVKTAVIDVASASGLTLIAPHERNPLTATSYGTGMLMRQAWEYGCRAFIIGLGGSATVDGGRGLLESLGVRFLDASRSALPRGVTALQHLDAIDTTGACHDPLNAPISILSDVTNPLFGPHGAAAVFGPQKGASPADIEQLERSLSRLSAILEPHKASSPGAGAAGGIGFALLTLPHARLLRGIDAVLDLLQFDAAVADASLVITGEGRIDRTSLAGKVPVGVLHRVGQRCPVAALAGVVADRHLLDKAGFAAILCINDYASTPNENPLDPVIAARRITDTVAFFVKNSKQHLHSM